MPLFNGNTNLTGWLGIGSGLGTAAPSGPLHVKGSEVGLLLFSTTGVNSATPRIILPTGSITLFVQIPLNGGHIRGHASGPVPWSMSMSPNGGTSDYTVDIYGPGGEFLRTDIVLRFTCNTDGSLTVHRVISSGSYDVYGFLLYA